MAYIVGRGQVSNIKAQLYKYKVLFRGIDCDIKRLSTIRLGDETDSIKTPTQPTTKPTTQPSSGNRTLHSTKAR